MNTDLHHGPARLEMSTDLVVGEEALGPGGDPGGASVPGSSVQAVVLGVGEGEALPVQRHPHHQLLLGGPGLDPVVHGEVLKINIRMN